MRAVRGLPFSHGLTLRAGSAQVALPSMMVAAMTKNCPPPGMLGNGPIHRSLVII